MTSQVNGLSSEIRELIDKFNALKTINETMKEIRQLQYDSVNDNEQFIELMKIESKLRDEKNKIIGLYQRWQIIKYVHVVRKTKDC